VAVTFQHLALFHRQQRNSVANTVQYRPGLHLMPAASLLPILPLECINEAVVTTKSHFEPSSTQLKHNVQLHGILDIEAALQDLSSISVDLEM
jgi:hypothetical protein